MKELYSLKSITMPGTSFINLLLHYYCILIVFSPTRLVANKENDHFISSMCPPQCLALGINTQLDNQ